MLVVIFGILVVGWGFFTVPMHSTMFTSSFLLFFVFCFYFVLHRECYSFCVVFCLLWTILLLSFLHTFCSFNQRQNEFQEWTIHRTHFQTKFTCVIPPATIQYIPKLFIATEHIHKKHRTRRRALFSLFQWIVSQLRPKVCYNIAPTSDFGFLLTYINNMTSNR